MAGKPVLGAKESAALFERWSPADPKYNSGYVLLEARADGDAEHRTWKELLKKTAPDPVTVVNGNGELQEVWSKADLKEAAKRRGIELGKKSSTQVADEKKRKEKEERLKSVAAVALPKCLAAVEGMELTPKVEEALLRIVLGLEMWPDVFYEMDEKSLEKRTGFKSLKELAKKAPLRQLRSALVELVLSDEPAGCLEYSGAEYKPAFAAVCEFAGVDLKAEEKAAAEEVSRQEAKTPSGKDKKEGAATPPPARAGRKKK
jgi:hypothetical protein